MTFAPFESQENRKTGSQREVQLEQTLYHDIPVGLVPFSTWGLGEDFRLPKGFQGRKTFYNAPFRAFRYKSFKNNHLTEMFSGSKEGSHLRLIDFCITQLYRFERNEGEEEEE